MNKTGFRLSEKKGADQLCSNYTTDQRLRIHYLASTISLHLKSEISSFYPSSVTAQTVYVGPSRKPR